jgi:hypothetical protein
MAPTVAPPHEPTRRQKEILRVEEMKQEEKALQAEFVAKREARQAATAATNQAYREKRARERERAPKTKAPKTKASKTKAPKTKASKTKASKTGPKTKAPYTGPFSNAPYTRPELGERSPSGSPPPTPNALLFLNKTEETCGYTPRTHSL